MTERGDELVEGAAERFERAADRAASQPTVPDMAAGELRDDASFLRQLKPSLVRARIRGEAPDDLPPAQAAAAPSGPQVRAQPASDGEGPNPFLVIGAALALGIVLAKIVDWRGHAHPRR